MAVITLNTTKKIDVLHFSERKKLSDKLTEEMRELLSNSGYSNKTIELYTNRVNVGSIENADVTLAYTGPCGDTCKIFLKINQQNVIEDAKFQYLGCPASAACGSIMAHIAKGKTLQEAEGITAEKILEELGGLPDDECHCATLVLTTLFNAIKKYKNKK
jgi:NifU-like protein involved in Fe-S cluster formation